MNKEYPIIEFDPSLPAIIEPSKIIRKIESPDIGCWLEFRQMYYSQSEL